MRRLQPERIAVVEIVRMVPQQSRTSCRLRCAGAPASKEARPSPCRRSPHRRWRRGRRAAADPRARPMARWPAYGELVTFPAELAVKHPPALGFEAAATTWKQYLTAYGALVDIARLRRDEPVVITAASSSVGLAAIQVANSIGAVAIAVTWTSAKKKALLDTGAAYAVASQEEDLEA